MWKFLIVLSLSLLSSCVRSQPEIIVITATFEPEAKPQDVNTPSVNIHATPTSAVQPGDVFANPTADPTRPRPEIASIQQHVVEAGDTLYGISLAYNVNLDALLAANNLVDPNVLFVGQVIQLPSLPEQETPNMKLIPDIRLVRGPGSVNFDVQAFVASQPGYIRRVTDNVSSHLANNATVEEILSGAEVIERVSAEYSVDPRLLLALLELRAGWLSNPEPGEELRDYPLILPDESVGIDRAGLYRQLAWAANELNRGYYNWKYRGVITLTFKDGMRLLYAPGLNAGTVGVQYFLSLNESHEAWLTLVGEQGLFQQVYNHYFGYPFQQPAVELIPANLSQPLITLPFASGETWLFTGGPHGGWGSGSAWSAVDFAPPDDLDDNSPLCYTSSFWATAVAPGVIVRSGGGAVVLDLDGDGDETTGWTILYLHLASQGRVAAGTKVEVGDNIGHPSCEGGFSNATHMHIARRYNGEWIPADCQECAPGHTPPRLVMSGWQVSGISKQEYQGYLVKDNNTRIAEQGRLITDNQVSW